MGSVKVIVSQERLTNNHPLVSVCTLQSKQIQYSCEVRSGHRCPASGTAVRPSPRTIPIGTRSCSPFASPRTR